MVYRNPNKNLRMYKMIMLEPVEVRTHRGAGNARVSEQDRRQLSDYFHEEITAALSDSFPKVNQPGPGVMRVRAAITNVTPSKPLANVVPVPGQPNFGLGGASIEAELVDAQSGERIAAFMGSGHGKRYRKLRNTGKWGPTKDQLRDWALLLRDTLDEARGLHGDKTFRTSGGMFR